MNTKGKSIDELVVIKGMICVCRKSISISIHNAILQLYTRVPAIYFRDRLLCFCFVASFCSLTLCGAVFCLLCRFRLDVDYILLTICTSKRVVCMCAGAVVLLTI